MLAGDAHLTSSNESPAQHTSPTVASAGTEAPRKQSRSHVRRRKKRQEQRAEQGHRPSPAAVQKYVVDATKIHIPIDCATLLATRGGYRTRNTNINAAQAAYNKQELLSGHGFNFLDWNGVDPLLIIDSKDRIAIALVGQLQKEDFQGIAHSCHQALLAEGLLLGEANHSRSGNVIINTGITYGKGTREPVSLDPRQNGAVASRLLNNPHIQRFSSFASASLALYAPKLYDHCRVKLNTLPVQFPRLAPFFSNGTKVFPATAFDLGPATSAQKNRTALNHPYGWTATQALGQFDPTKGGQLVFWELRLIVQFPPGALVLHPAAMITVTTTPVNEGETRTSITQYIPASLFQYVESGYRSAKELKVHNTAAHQGDLKSGADKWRMGLDLFTTLDELPK